MDSFALPDQVVQNLQKHPQATRMKKLLLLAAKNVWETDSQKLEAINIRDILQELFLANPQQENFKQALYQAANSLNKKEEYILLSNAILTLIEEIFSPQSSKSLSQTITVVNAAKKIVKFPQNPEDLFTIKADIFRYANPLKAKILIFSVLYHQFRYTDEEFALLKRQKIDELIVKLYRFCSSAGKLNYQLQSTAKALHPKEENIQTAQTIFMVMKTYYPDSGEDLESTQSLVSQPPVYPTWQDWQDEDEEDDDQTCQLTGYSLKPIVKEED